MYAYAHVPLKLILTYVQPLNTYSGTSSCQACPRQVSASQISFSGIMPSVARAFFKDGVTRAPRARSPRSLFLDDKVVWVTLRRRVGPAATLQAGRLVLEALEGLQRPPLHLMGHDVVLLRLPDSRALSQ